MINFSIKAGFNVYQFLKYFNYLRYLVEYLELGVFIA